MKYLSTGWMVEATSRYFILKKSENFRKLLFCLENLTKEKSFENLPHRRPYHATPLNVPTETFETLIFLIIFFFVDIFTMFINKFFLTLLFLFCELASFRTAFEIRCEKQERIKNWLRLNLSGLAPNQTTRPLIPTPLFDLALPPSESYDIRRWLSTLLLRNCLRPTKYYLRMLIKPPHALPSYMVSITHC